MSRNTSVTNETTHRFQRPKLGSIGNYLAELESTHILLGDLGRSYQFFRDQGSTDHPVGPHFGTYRIYTKCL